MSSVTVSVIVLVALGLFFGFLNGFHDSSNIVATMIASRALTGRQALTIVAIAESLAPFVFGVAVATTIGNEVLNLNSIDLSVTLAALCSAIVWNLLTWWLGIPSSSSHALVGGLIGAAIVEDGFAVVKLAGVGKVLVALFVSPFLGSVVGYFFMELVLFLVRGAHPGVNEFFKRIQIFTAIALALSHGSNDAQKTMGVIAMGLVATGAMDTFQVPLWVVAVSALAMALGTWTGGWRLIRTLGAKFYKIRPIHGFTVQASSATVILGAAVLGGPVSTTQVVSSAILGVGSAERLSKVRWGVMRQILMAWVTTIPFSALLAAGLLLVFRYWA